MRAMNVLEPCCHCRRQKRQGVVSSRGGDVRLTDCRTCSDALAAKHRQAGVVLVRLCGLCRDHRLHLSAGLFIAIGRKCCSAGVCPRER